MELLITTVPGGGGFEAGDVIAWHAAGSHWGAAELAHPGWRIVRVPGLEADEAEGLTAAEVTPGPHPHEYVARTRGMTIDLAAPWLGASRSPSGIDADLTPEAIRLAVSLKPPVPHPDLVGPPTTHTIG